MSFQGYLDTIKDKTGLDPDDFVALAAEKGLAGPDLKAGPIIDWLATDYSLGRGHAMAIVAVLKQSGGPLGKVDDKLAKLFSGARADWRPVFDALLVETQKFGADVSVSPGGTYASLVRGAKKFGIVEPKGQHFDIGIKRKGVAPEGRFAAAGDWNSMVTHLGCRNSHLAESGVRSGRIGLEWPPARAIYQGMIKTLISALPHLFSSAGARLFLFRKEVVTLWRALLAPETPLHLKAATLFAAFYLISPLDLLPDVIPVLGWVDDIILVPLMVSWIVSRLPKPVYAGKYGKTVDGKARRK